MFQKLQKLSNTCSREQKDKKEEWKIVLHCRSVPAVFQFQEKLHRQVQGRGLPGTAHIQSRHLRQPLQPVLKGVLVDVQGLGRGGQGAKTASLLLADAAFNTGKYVQGFPEYGPERMGAPITAYNRISSERSTVHSNIYFPDYVVVVDETLLSSVDVTAGLKEDGAIVINSGKAPADLRPLLKGYQGRVCTIDAGKISEEELGKNFPNTPMLAAIVKVSGVVEPDAFVKDMEASFHHKFATKPQVIEGNMRALKRSMEEVQVG